MSAIELGSTHLDARIADRVLYVRINRRPPSPGTNMFRRAIGSAEMAEGF